MSRPIAVATRGWLTGDGVLPVSVATRGWLTALVIPVPPPPEPEPQPDHHFAGTSKKVARRRRDERDILAVIQAFCEVTP